MTSPFSKYESDPGWQYLKLSDAQRAQDQNRPYDSKKDCWVPDPEDGYVAAQIKSATGDNITVTTAKGNEVTLKKDLVQEMNPPKFDKAEDMSNLSFLNDASVLGNLRARYGCMLIYTYSGLFCVVINPYKRLPIYTDSVAKMYIGKRKNEMPPHLFAVSEEAYRNMLQDRENQSMLITGESGAGKTENTKKVIAYFATVGSSQAGGEAADTGKKKVSLEDQIVQTNPVLEAFGNAKTVRNNNSSRFGKFIRIHFNGGGKVAGCDIEHYLLEKSRVIRQAPGERCYHIFYQIYTSADLRKKLQLSQELRYYHFVSQAELTIDGVNDTEEFKMADEAFDILMFSPEEKMDCYKMMATIMHMGEMKFKQKPRDEQAEPDGDEEAKFAAEMMGIDAEKFLNSLTKPRVKVGNEWVNKGQNVEQVNWAIGAMSKGAYARIFHWLVKKCNMTLDAKGLERKHFCGVLDIAGFEIFDFNSFEQLWINFVNEKLQQFFNHHMFVLEQEEYKREGIDWVFIDFGLDLAACIELIEKPLGIISMLDEECIVPKATDMTLAQKLTDTHLGKHPNFVKPAPPKGKQAEAHFAMKHYAGTVRYNVSNWLEKNKDPLNDTTVSVMKSNPANKLLAEIWSDYMTQEEQAAAAKEGKERKKGKSASMMTVSMMYRESLNNLMSMLNSTHPHFVRCIIPNELKRSGLLDAALVMNQLTCNGVLEGIRICRKGFPNRMQHPDFKQRYSILAAEAAKSSEDPKEVAAAILQQLIKQKDMNAEMFRVGHTKVFFKAGVLAHMEDLRDEKLSAVMVGLQARILWHLGLKEMKARHTQQSSILVIQNNIRSWSVLRSWDWYLIFGKIRPLLNKAKEEMEKMRKNIKAMEERVAELETSRKKMEAEIADFEGGSTTLLKELEDRRNNANLTADRATQLSNEANGLQKQVDELNGVVEKLESKNEESSGNNKKIEAENAALRSQKSDLEKALQAAEGDKKSREDQILSLNQDKSKGEEMIAKLTRQNKDLNDANWRMKDDIQSTDDKAAKMLRDKASLQRKCEDLEELMDKEQRHKRDTEGHCKNIEEELRKALQKIEGLTQQCQEAETNMRNKEKDVHAAIERLKDESSRVSRLEQQLIDLGNAVMSVGRT